MAANAVTTPDGKPIVVLDNGTGSIKIGYAGTTFPSAVIPTVVGRPLLRSSALKQASQQQTSRAAAAAAAQGSGAASPAPAAAQIDLKETMIGDECNSVRHLLEISNPIGNGIVRNENDMALLWNYAFSEKLRQAPADCFISTSEPPGFGDNHRAKIFEMLFEKFGVQGIQTSLQGTLVLYSIGETTGIAVDCGEATCQMQPIFEGTSLARGLLRVNIGGRHVTEQLIKLMQIRGYDFNRSADFETARSIKEMFCYSAVDPKLERKLALDTTVLEKAMVLPDGNQCVIGAERFQAPEVLFSPGLLNIDSDGLSQQIWNSIQNCPIDVRSSLYGNIVLSGGSSMFPGLPSRIERDIKELYLEKALKGDRSKLSRFKLKIVDAPRRKHMVYQGSACFSALTAANVTETFMSKKEYEDEGVSGITRRFAQRS